MIAYCVMSVFDRVFLCHQSLDAEYIFLSQMKVHPGCYSCAEITFEGQAQPKVLCTCASCLVLIRSIDSKKSRTIRRIKENLHEKTLI